MSQLSQFLSKLGVGIGAWIVFGVVLVFFAAFLIWYVRPYIMIRRRLSSIVAEIAFKGRHETGGVMPFDDISTIMTQPPFDHLWSEYQESLHKQYQVIDGRQRLVAVRATVPAEVYFTQQALIDTPLCTEFFRHLPGILTGTGIIGTFWGLLQGLRHFNAKGDAKEIRESLDLLFHGVFDAFMASFGAIFVAMLVTLVEKLCYRHLCRLVENLTSVIDALYQSGVAEEYLQDLVTSSRQSATHAGQLKDSLVGELKIIMNNLGDRLADLNERQLKTQGQQSEAAAERISQAVSDNIKEPLARMSEAVIERETHQGQAATGAMERYFAEFMEKFETTFGGKFEDLTVAMESVVHSTRETQDRFKDIIENIRLAGSQTSEAMAQQYNTMMADAASQLTTITASMAEMTKNIGGDLGKAQEASSANLAALMTAAEERQLQMQKVMEHFLEQTREDQSQHSKLKTEQLESALQQMQRSMIKIGQHLAKLQQDSVEQTKRAFGEILAETARLATTASTTTAQMEQTLTRLNATAGMVIDKMTSGVETLYHASTDFAKAGLKVETVLTRGSELFATLTKASTTLEQSIGTVSKTLADYSQQRQTLTTLVTTLEQLIRNAQAEAGFSAKRIEETKTIVAKMGELQQQAEQYFKGINQVLERAFQTFSTATQKSITTSATEFTSGMKTAVEMLKDQIGELDNILGEFVERHGQKE